MDLSIGENALDFDAGKSISDSKVRIRNKAGEMGANYLVIDTIEVHQNDSGRYYSATGRAYVCPE